MKKSMRNSMVLALFVGLALLLSGVVSAQDQVTLEWWDYLGDTGNDADALHDLIARYEAAHPNVTIERTVIPFGDLKTRVIQGAATGTVPDIVIIDNPDHQSMAAQGAFADITDLVADWPDVEQYFEGPWSSTIYEGRNYGLPFKSNATALFYNVDLLTEAGYDAPPETWDALQEVALALTQGDVVGFCFSAITTEEGTFTMLPFLWGAGGDIPTIGDDASIEMLTFLNTLVNVDQSVPTSVLNFTQGDANNLFMAGQCAMMINGPWQIPGIMANADVDFEWSVSGWPYSVQPTSILGGENFAIGAGTHVQEAWDVISWAVQPANLIPTLQINGQFPGRADAAADPYFTDDPIRAIFSQQVSVAKPRAYGPNYPQMSEEIMRMIQGVLTGAQTPEEASAAAHDVIQPLLETSEATATPSS